MKSSTIVLAFSALLVQSALASPHPFVAPRQGQSRASINQPHTDPIQSQPQLLQLEVQHLRLLHQAFHHHHQPIPQARAKAKPPLLLKPAELQMPKQLLQPKQVELLLRRQAELLRPKPAES
jgi:hypothetical protein